MWSYKRGIKRPFRLHMIWRAVNICNKHGYIYKGVDVDEKRKKVIYRFIKGDNTLVKFC